MQIYDTWMEAIEKGDMVGLGLIDITAAFDCVNADLLLAKTKLFNFSRHAQQFVRSFMEGRLQVTEVMESTSSTLRLGGGRGGSGVGVAQG